jgi:hypothetical protein
MKGIGNHFGQILFQLRKYMNGSLKSKPLLVVLAQQERNGKWFSVPMGMAMSTLLYEKLAPL